MKKLFTAFQLFIMSGAMAQIGIGTTSPNSTLDVRGSFSTPLTSFSSNLTAGASDNMLLFTGTSGATLTLPTAAGIAGREYWIKNVSSNGSVLAIATTSSQTIDGQSSWSLAQTNKVVRLISNGANWYAAAESLPGSVAGTPWNYGGNNVTAQQNFGTTSNYALPFITNNTERMRLTATGSLGIGTSTFNATYPERLLVDGGATGNTNYQNVIVGKGNTNSYAQLNIQNTNAGTGASADVVATANNGDETTNFVDMGINSGSNTSIGVLGGANTAYLYATGADFVIGNAGNTHNLNFFTTTGGTSAERMRISSTGNVGIANTAPSEKLDVTGNVRFSGALMPNNSAGTAGYFLQSAGAGAAPVWFDPSSYTWLTNGNTNTSLKTLGTTNAYDLPIITNNTEKMRITSNGTVGIGTSTFSATNPEELIVDAGTNGSNAYQNVIVGKGNTNSYAQLNIQNNSSGTAASSDVVATANNGTESVNFIDMGINGGGNTSTGVLGGANTAYLYSTGNDFAIGNSKDDKNLYFYTSTGGASTERMRITGTGYVGIGNITPNSTFEVSGSVGHSIVTTSSNLTLDATNYTVIVTGGSPTISFPAAAAGNNRRIYVIVNQNLTSITTSSYRSFTGGATTSVGGYSSITIQSNGTNWYRIQ